MVLGRADTHPDGHRIVGGVTRAATQHHELCVGTLDDMRTDSKALFDAGLVLSQELWEEAKSEFDWSDIGRYVFHQISQVHTAAMTKALDIDPDQGAPHVPHPRQHRPGLGPVHPGRCRPTRSAPATGCC